MLDWRLKAYRHWLTMEEPHAWADGPVSADRLSEDDLLLGAASRSYKSIDEVDPESCSTTYEKLGIPLQRADDLLASNEANSRGRCGVRFGLGRARHFKKKLAEKGIIFCSFGEAVQKHPELVKKYMGSVVPY